MKRFIAVIAIGLAGFFCATAAFSLSFRWAAGTAAVSYGSPAVKENNNTIISGGKYAHFLLSGELGTTLQLDEQLFGSVSFTPVLDFYSGTHGHALYVDYSLCTGLQLVPGLGGAVFGVDYCVGIRQDIVRIDTDSSASGFSRIGNGFRFLAEYDFSVHTGGVAPVLGVSYRFMPRGGNTGDNIFSLYLSIR